MAQTLARAAGSICPCAKRVASPELRKGHRVKSHNGVGRMRAEEYLAPETLMQLAPFELRARAIVEGLASGMHRSPYQGLAVEFAEHRQYTPGDSIRTLDWKVFARTDKLYVKRYEQETNLDVVVLVDRSRSMRFGSLEMKSGWGGTDPSRATARWTKWDHATAITAALAYLCLQQGDRVGVATFSDALHTSLRRNGARDQWRAIVQALSIEPVTGKANFARAAEQALAKVHNRALFFIVSDFLGSHEEVRAMLARFRHRKDDLVLVQTLDRQELRFDLEAPAPFAGLEGEPTLETDPQAIRAAYLEVMREHIDKLATTTRAFGADFFTLDTHESVGPALAALLDRRTSFQGRRAR